MSIRKVGFWFNKNKFVGLLFPVMCLCVFSQKALSQEPNFPLYVKDSVIWSSNDIPVCWENPSSNFTNEMRWVKEAAVNSWQSISAVNFTGWANCNARSKGIRILIQDVGPKTQGLGSELDGLRDGMTLNFTFQNWNQSCQSSPSRRESCIRLIAIHEFGHALGFSHEQNRPDTPRNQPGSTQQWCVNEIQGSYGTLLVGTWDLNSVMNYCNPKWIGDGRLSQTDIQGVRQFYPLLAPLALYWSGQRKDNATVSTRTMRRSQEQSGYAGPNIQGCIFSRQEPGTIPLYLFWHQQRQDNATVATPEMIQSQKASGYGNPAIQGYIYPADRCR